jgi:hypothetical protein
VMLDDFQGLMLAAPVGCALSILPRADRAGPATDLASCHHVHETAVDVRCGLSIRRGTRRVAIVSGAPNLAGTCGNGQLRGS